MIKNYEGLKKGIVYMGVNGVNKFDKLGDVCEMKSGKLTSKDISDDGTIPFYNGSANPDFKSTLQSFNYDNYILMIKDGGAGYGKHGDNIGLGKVFFVTGKTACTTSVICINVKNILCKYVYYYLSSQKNKIMDMAQYGVGLGHVSMEKIKNITIPKLSQDKQNEIITKCEYYDEQINKLILENDEISKWDIINKVLNSVDINEDLNNDDDVNNDELNDNDNDKEDKSKKVIINNKLNKDDNDKKDKSKKTKSKKVIINNDELNDKEDKSKKSKSKKVIKDDKNKKIKSNVVTI
jgi:hypothetical protein